MKINYRTIASIVGGAMIVAGCASTGKLAKEQAGLTKEQVDAPGLFAESCAGCHGKDGRAKTFRGHWVGAQNFTDAKWRADTTADQMVHVIKGGKDKMPSFDGKLSDAEIEALAAYVLTFKATE